MIFVNDVQLTMSSFYIFGNGKRYDKGRYVDRKVLQNIIQVTFNDADLLLQLIQ